MGSTPNTATITYVLNPFDNLTPPNMDVMCNTTSTPMYVAGILQSTNIQQTCSNPIYYYLGYSIDIIIVISTAWLIKWILT